MRFEPVGEWTRVTFEHTGWERLPAARAAHKMRFKQSGWTNILGWYTDRTDWSSPFAGGRSSSGGLEFVRGLRRQFQVTFGG